MYSNEEEQRVQFLQEDVDILQGSELVPCTGQYRAHGDGQNTVKRIAKLKK